MRIIVADTGPLIHLHEAGSLHLLSLAGDVFVTPQVMSEWKSQPEELRPASIPEWIRCLTPSTEASLQSQAWLQSGLLHGGEAESLAVALEAPADWFLTDDAAPRLLATRLGVETHGSLGIILWAAAQRRLTQSDARLALDRLERSTLWLSAAVRAQARLALQHLFESDPETQHTRS
jgi:predicted nucleic acid-binding protein